MPRDPSPVTELYESRTAHDCFFRGMFDFCTYCRNCTVLDEFLSPNIVRAI